MPEAANDGGPDVGRDKPAIQIVMSADAPTKRHPVRLRLMLVFNL
jgi:hypothetical protein